MGSYDAYVRVSKVGERAGSSSFISPDVQRETITRLASIHGLTIGELVEELDISGSKPIEERELGRLVRKVERGASAGLSSGSCPASRAACSTVSRSRIASSARAGAYSPKISTRRHRWGRRCSACCSASPRKI